MPRMKKQYPPIPLASLINTVPLAENAPHFTAREKQVLRLTFAGLVASETADRLLIGERTVHFHLNHVYAKLKASSHMTALNRVVALGLFTTIFEEEGAAK